MKQFFEIHLLFLFVFGGMTLLLTVMIYIFYFLSEKNCKLSQDILSSHLSYKVSGVKVENDIEDAMRYSLDLWDAREYLKSLINERNKNIIIKPNFTGGSKDKAGTQTNPEILSAVFLTTSNDAI